MFVFAVAGQKVQQGFDLGDYGVRIEPDKRLIVVLAALEMAESKKESGTTEKLINTPLSAKGEKFRAQLLQDNAGMDADLRRRISMFVAQYKKRHPKLSDAEIVELNIPTGQPLVYELDKALKPKRSYYLGDEEAIRAKMLAVANQGKTAA